MGPKLYTPSFNRLDIEFSLNGVRERADDFVGTMRGIK